MTMTTTAEMKTRTTTMTNNATKTILAFGDGSTLVSSPGGDLYWFVYPDGTSAQCPLQQASRYWMQYEESLRVGPNLPQEDFCPEGRPTSYATATPSECPMVSRAVQDYQGGREYSPWQRELLQKLGLTEADADPIGEARKKDKGKKHGDRE
jgi:hypothetical protein